MALDRWIFWKEAREGTPTRPTREQVLTVIQQFFHPDVATVSWKDGRWFVSLLGSRSEALCGVGPYRTVARDAAARERAGEERWIEVWLDEKSMDIITREGDDYTNACALGLARVFTLGWDGTLGEW